MHFLLTILACLSITTAAAIAPAQAESGPSMLGPPSDAEKEYTPSPANGVDNLDGQGSKESVKTATALPPLTQSPTFERLSNIVSDSYTIGAEDVLDITVWRNQDLSRVVQVRPDGRFSMPVIRDVSAVGKTPNQLADEITKRLKEYVQNPVVAISVREVNSYNIFVLGEVVKPGKYPLKSKTTLLQGITMAGGFTPVAARNQVVVFRFSSNASGMQMLSASYDDIVLRGGIPQNIELKAGDTIVVPSETMVVFPGQ